MDVGLIVRAKLEVDMERMYACTTNMDVLGGKDVQENKANRKGWCFAMVVCLVCRKRVSSKHLSHSSAMVAGVHQDRR
jgi:hypothetical protein